MRSIRFGHIAIAVPRLVDAQAMLEGELGAASTFGAVTAASRFWHWRFEGGGRLEVLRSRTICRDSCVWLNPRKSSSPDTGSRLAC